MPIDQPDAPKSWIGRDSALVVAVKPGPSFVFPAGSAFALGTDAGDGSCAGWEDSRGLRLPPELVSPVVDVARWHEDCLRSVGAFSRSLMDLPGKRGDYYIINITLSYIHRQEAGSGSGLTMHTTSYYA